MNREWRPGDVAIISDDRALRTSRGTWIFQADGVRWTDKHIADAGLTPRPLVVIDPEDESGDLSRLWRLLPDNLVSIDQLQAALREFADPKPKPEEPTGLGARVVVTWNSGKEESVVRYRRSGGADWCTEAGCHVKWDDLPSVRVVQP